ncbi:HlyC/CorC family transporter [Actinosynnema pretiosum subsp. pretiosum]|uniref:HlyC/CorC family transporter n=1 Tax=Actinosynnema pretiosum subsp. pretiosum TaxID=103721 RepID=A0AA45LAL2_9PSEU|nr:Magnesium and cobalt efflux protein CorC [Actinosynnema pretiosum subsp. pretiosum]QUF05800.1 HlyC/CorC family transporter [Actinosynnema pretiosum subsp. pretiosum]
MDGYGFNIALVVVLLLFNALFAGSEMALISLREGQLRALEREGGSGGRTLVRLARDPNRFLATIQIGITLAGFLASATAAVSLAAPLVPLLSFVGGAADAVAVALVTIVLTFVTLVFGELAPKRLAMQYALRWALLVAKPLHLLSTVSRPVIWLLSTSTNAVVRVFGGKAETDAEEMSPEELRELVSAQRGLNTEQRMIINGALEIHERRLREVFVPRRNVVVLDAALDVPSARAELAASGHSRAPVARGGHLDDLVGVVHLRDLLSDTTPLAELVRAAVVFPDSLRVSDALRRFKTDHEQFALVVDEHGAVDGIVTLEDLLEEIVGEIYDETDRDVMAVRHEDDGALVLPGSFPVHDLVDLGVELPGAPEGDYTTVAGLLLTVLGHIPERAGERAEVSGWDLEILAVERRAITSVRLRRVKALG